MAEGGDQGPGAGTARAWLRAQFAAVDRGPGPERRHETLMERAEGFGLPRPEAETVYALAEDAGLEPELALLLRVSGLGVVEGVDPEPAQPEQQQSPAALVEVPDVAPEDARRERRLRLSFRRLNTLLAESGSAAAAAERFATGPDVAEDAY